MLVARATKPHSRYRPGAKCGGCHATPQARPLVVVVALATVFVSFSARFLFFFLVLDFSHFLSPRDHGGLMIFGGRDFKNALLRPPFQS